MKVDLRVAMVMNRDLRVEVMITVDPLVLAKMKVDLRVEAVVGVAKDLLDLMEECVEVTSNRFLKPIFFQINLRISPFDKVTFE